MALIAQVRNLREYDPVSFTREEISNEVETRLWNEYSNKISYEAPSIKNNDQWILTAQGWVGYLPITDDLHFRLLPKVPVKNIFRMLEYAFKLEHMPGMQSCETLEEFYDKLAHLLAQQVLRRGRMGWYRAYVPQEERLAFVRGRIDAPRLRPWDTLLPCAYEDHTADVEENRLLAWTLHVIARSGLCCEETLVSVRKAYRAVAQIATVTPMLASECRGRHYHRLNEDYRPLHALCHFFLANAGPTHLAGGHEMIPFLVDMDKLFEDFVAAWLDTHLPDGWRIIPQKRITVGEHGEYEFRIDLVLYNSEGGPSIVMDTKYKRPKTRLSDDIAQVVCYAVLTRCKEAVLIYPSIIPNSFDATLDDIHVRSLAFPLDDDNLDAAGQNLLAALGFGSYSCAFH